MSVVSAIRSFKKLIIGDVNDDYSLQPNRNNAVEGSILRFNSIDNEYKHYISPNIGLSRDTGQSVPNSSNTAIQWNTTLWLNGNIQLNANNTDIQVNENGKYLITYESRFASNSVGQRRSFISINNNNGGNVRRFGKVQLDATSSGVWAATGTTIVDLVNGDFVSLIVWQNSGGNIIFSSTNLRQRTEITIVKIAE